MPLLSLQPNWLDSLIKEFFPRNEKRTFIDVGVNLGQSLFRLKSISPEAEYIGFEPNASCVDYVQKNVDNNKIDYCRIYNCALGNETKPVFLHLQNETDSCGTIIKNLRTHAISQTLPSLMIKFDEVFKSEKIDFLKIDVEGAELDVISGMIDSVRANRCIITCEVLDYQHADVAIQFQLRADQLCELLDSVEYKIIRLLAQNDQMINFEVVDKIQLKQWDSSSLDQNDYIFVPIEKYEFVVETLQKIVNGKC